MSSKFVSINRGEAFFMSSVGVITDGYHFYTFTTIGGGLTAGTDLPATPTWGYSASEPVDLTGYSLSVSVMTGGGKQFNYGLDSPKRPFTGHNSEENVLGFGVQVGLTHTKFTGGPYWRLDGQSGLPTAGELSWYYGKLKDPLKDNPDFAPVVSGIDLINHEMTGGLNGTQSIDQINPFSVFSYVGGPASDVSGISLAYGFDQGGSQSAEQFDPFAAYGAQSIDPSSTFGTNPFNSATVYPGFGNAWDVPGTSLTYGSDFSGGSAPGYNAFDVFGTQGAYDTGSIDQLTTFGTDPSSAWASASDWSRDPVIGASFDETATGVAGVGFTSSSDYYSGGYTAQNPASGLPSGRALPKRRDRSVVRPVLASLQQTVFKGRDAKMRAVSASGARVVQKLRAVA